MCKRDTHRRKNDNLVIATELIDTIVSKGSYIYTKHPN